MCTIIQLKVEAERNNEKKNLQRPRQEIDLLIHRRKTLYLKKSCHEREILGNGKEELYNRIDIR